MAYLDLVLYIKVQRCDLFLGDCIAHIDIIWRIIGTTFLQFRRYLKFIKQTLLICILFGIAIGNNIIILQYILYVRVNRCWNRSPISSIQSLGYMFLCYSAQDCFVWYPYLRKATINLIMLEIFNILEVNCYRITILLVMWLFLGLSTLLLSLLWSCSTLFLINNSCTLFSWNLQRFPFAFFQIIHRWVRTRDFFLIISHKRVHFCLVLNINCWIIVVFFIRLHLLLDLQALRRISLAVLVSAIINNTYYTSITLVIFIYILLFIRIFLFSCQFIQLFSFFLLELSLLPELLFKKWLAHEMITFFKDDISLW